MNRLPVVQILVYSVMSITGIAMAVVAGSPVIRSNQTNLASLGGLLLIGALAGLITVSFRWNSGNDDSKVPARSRQSTTDGCS